jgi:hypothetical protein
MSIVNGILNGLGNVLFLVTGFLHPILTILVLSVLVGAGSLVVFKWTSDQKKIRAAKGPMKGHLLGIFLFRHDLRQVFRALGLALWQSVANLRFLAAPMAVMIVPLVLLFVQFELRLGMRGLAVGERTTLAVHVIDAASLDDVELSAPEGVVVETPGVRVHDPERDLCEVDFRIRAEAAGDHELVVASGGREVTKIVTVGGDLALLSPVRPSGLLSALLYPAEEPLPGDGHVSSIELAYPAITYAFLGIDWAWWVLFLIFMILALFALRGPLGVDF